MKILIPGLNIQWPWAGLILSGVKTVETRGYPLPEKYIGIDLAIIETPGKSGLRLAGIERAKIVGVVQFDTSFKYESKGSWLQDFGRHQVPQNHPELAWGKSEERWGWPIKLVRKIDSPTIAPSPRGIVFASNCEITI